MSVLSRADGRLMPDRVQSITFPRPGWAGAGSTRTPDGGAMRCSPRPRPHAARVLEDAHQQASRAAALAISGGDAPTGPGRSDLAAELAYLRTFSDVYRTHLRAYLEALLRNVAEWERAERSSLAAVRTDLPAGLPAGPVP
jgi:hypothetical protein